MFVDVLCVCNDVLVEIFDEYVLFGDENIWCVCVWLCVIVFVFGVLFDWFWL